MTGTRQFALLSVFGIIALLAIYVIVKILINRIRGRDDLDGIL